MNYKVYIPSKGRAGRVTTHKLFLDSIIVCPENEVSEYKKHHEKVLGVDINVKGITQTRNWILDNVKDEWHIQVDDDAVSFYKHENGKRSTFIDKERIDKILTNQFILTEGWNLKGWGLALAGDYKFYREYQPFSTQKVVGANILGIIKRRL